MISPPNAQDSIQRSLDAIGGRTSPVEYGEFADCFFGGGSGSPGCAAK